MYTLLYIKWITYNKNLLYSTWNSGQRYVAAWMGEAFGGEWMHVYIWLSPFAVHLKRLYSNRKGKVFFFLKERCILAKKDC